MNSDQAGFDRLRHADNRGWGLKVVRCALTIQTDEIRGAARRR